MSTQPSGSKVKLCPLTESNVKLLNNGFLSSEHLPLNYPCKDNSKDIENFCDWSYFKKKSDDKIIIHKSAHLWHPKIVDRVKHQTDVLINDPIDVLRALPDIRTTKASRLLRINTSTIENRKLHQESEAYGLLGSRNSSSKYSGATMSSLDTRSQATSNATSSVDSSLLYFKKKYNRNFIN